MIRGVGRVLRKIVGVVFDAVVLCIVVFLFLEVALRLFPGLIPPSLLINFQKDLRQKIAVRAGFTIASDTLQVARDDGGPPNALYVFEPYGVVHTPPDRLDKFLIKVASQQMDESGFCNPHVLEHADIVVIGDSFTWCFNVSPEDAWYGKLTSLSGNSVYSLGVPAVGPYDELQFLKQYGIEKTPKVVVMNIFAGNDFASAAAFHRYRAHPYVLNEPQDTGFSCVGLPGPLCGIYRFLKESAFGRTSYVFGLVSNASRNGVVTLKKFSHPQEAQPNRRYALVLSDGTEVDFNAANEDQWPGAEDLYSGKESLNAFNDALKAFVDLSQKYQFIPVVTLTPSASTVYHDNIIFEDPERAALVRWFGDEQRVYFSDHAESFGYFFLDFTPALEEAAVLTYNDLLYFPSNTHLTERGNVVIANALNSFLDANNILPAFP